MRKTVLILSFLISVVQLSAQNPEQFLEIDYQMEMKMDVEEILENVPSQWRAMVEDQIRQEIGDGIFIDYKLRISGEESEYKMVEKISNSQLGGGMIASQVSAMDKGILYKNRKEGIYTKVYDLGKTYLVQDSLIKFDWKITREKTEIAGFETYKAIGMMNDTIPVTAWYAPKLNFKDGPDRLWGLPGLILKTEFIMNGTDMVITAVNIAVREDEVKITRPVKGEIITEEEFLTVIKNIQKKYKEMYGDGVDTN